MKNNPQKPCTHFLVQPHSGLCFTIISPGVATPGYSDSTPFGVLNQLLSLNQQTLTIQLSVFYFVNIP